MMSTSVKKGRKSANEKPFLPDEIVTNILIRLPGKSLVRFELVCKKWRDIILSRDFIDLHLKTSIPLILVSSCKFYSKICELFALDKWWEFARNRTMTVRFPFNSRDFPYDLFVLLSHGGLIVLSDYSNICYILNPARPSNECVKITSCEGIFRTNICAVYYHPSLQEYVSLLKMEVLDSYTREPQTVHYKLLTLGSNPCLKTISSSLRYRMKESAEPLYINGYVYWMVMSEHGYKYKGLNDIVEFDIISEEFVVIPCPVPLNTECMNDQTHLLNNDGILIFVLILPSTIKIWSLEDHEEHLWTSVEYTVRLEVTHSSYGDVRVISLADGMLAFLYRRRLFICNLKEGSVKSNSKKGYTNSHSLFSHQMSLASLKKCRSELYIDKDGELLLQ